MIVTELRSSDIVSLTEVPCNTLSHRKDFGTITLSGAVAVHTMEKVLCGFTSMTYTLVTGLVVTRRDDSEIKIKPSGLQEGIYTNIHNYT